MFVAHQNIKSQHGSRTYISTFLLYCVTSFTTLEITLKNKEDLNFRTLSCKPSIFTYLSLVTTIIMSLIILIACDLQIKNGSTVSYSVGQCWGVFGPRDVGEFIFPPYLMVDQAGLQLMGLGVQHLDNHRFPRPTIDGNTVHLHTDKKTQKPWGRIRIYLDKIFYA